ncbi:hypothetical protein [uncultured Lacinutrix sp.]|uniref:hypothetical protein n=1 Tax=uncultured Lacinutrix sp. TaxID=574032 RepID=UPI00261C75FD|nr:hypothetical protein [uncultured Lacinutrix sp.]
MNLTNLNLLIDKNLTLLSKKDEHSEYYTHFLNEAGEQFWKIGKTYDAERLTKIMLEKDLIIITKELAVLTEFGYKVIKEGGWIKYSEESERKRISDEKLKKERDKIDLKLKKWQSKTFWWIFLIAIIGFIISIFNLYKSYNQPKKIDPHKKEIQSLNNDIQELKKFFENKKKDTIKIKSKL